jgi:hypothetical protein
MGTRDPFLKKTKIIFLKIIFRCSQVYIPQMSKKYVQILCILYYIKLTNM